MIHYKGALHLRHCSGTSCIMAEGGDENELLDYEEEETETPAEAQATKDLAKKDVKGTYVSIHSSGFRDFLLKPTDYYRLISEFCGTG